MLHLVSGDYGDCACKTSDRAGGNIADWFRAASVWRETASITRLPYVLDDDAL